MRPGGPVRQRYSYTRFLALIACLKIPAQATESGGIGSLELMLGLLKSLKIRALCSHVRKKVHTKWTQQLLQQHHKKYRLQFKNICVAVGFTHTRMYMNVNNLHFTLYLLLYSWL